MIDPSVDDFEYLDHRLIALEADIEELIKRLDSLEKQVITKVKFD